MKKSFLLLASCLHVLMVTAQYDVLTTPIPSTPPQYECTVVSTALIPDYTDQDLITWIFPDGQFKQQELEVDPTTHLPINNSNKFIWQPYVDAPSGGDNVVVFVAKKGQPGTPPKRIGSTPITGVFSGTPASFAMSTGKSWQVNRAWEFSPGTETLLIVSYVADPGCNPSDNKIFLTFEPSELEMIAPENLRYQYEDISPPMTVGSKKVIEIKDLKQNNIVNHVYLKFKLDSSVPLGQGFNIAVSGMICGKEISGNFKYVAKGTPHDPNEKIVNHPNICSFKPNKTDLSYYIRFQNDGNAPVFNVDIEDDLPVQLDPTSFSFGVVPRQATVLDNWNITGNHLHIGFKNLNLPGLKQTSPHFAYDQTLYDFTFNICTEANLPNITFINKADIYFYNGTMLLDPVYTNDASVISRIDTCYTSLVGCTVPTLELTNFSGNVQLSPNPFENDLSIAFDLPEKMHVSVNIWDINGQLVTTITNEKYSEGKHLLHWGDIQTPPGVYILEIRTPQARLKRKVIKI